jgi:hypothetical protein
MLDESITALSRKSSNGPAKADASNFPDFFRRFRATRRVKVCYRTSQQIRRAADRLLPTVLRDSDGIEDERRGIISVFDGPPPEVKSFPTIAAEAESVREVVASWLGEGSVAKSRLLRLDLATEFRTTRRPKPRSKASGLSA